MIIIPVLDLLNGQVVLAKKGARHLYQPVESALCHSAEPGAILEAYFNLYPFRKMYIADLNAIQADDDNLELVSHLATLYPDCQFWLDAGLEALKQAATYPARQNIHVVIGSENVMNEQHFVSLRQQYPDAALSLDFKPDGFNTNNYLLDSCKLWPEQVIVMMLSQVGTGNGIDWQTLEQIQRIAKKQKIYAAGGVGSVADLQRLKNRGISGALVATILHAGNINSEDIDALLGES